MEELFCLVVDPGEAFFAVARAEFGEEFAEAAFEGFLDASHLRLIYHGATRTEKGTRKNARSIQEQAFLCSLRPWPVTAVRRAHGVLR